MHNHDHDENVDGHPENHDDDDDDGDGGGGGDGGDDGILNLRAISPPVVNVSLPLPSPGQISSYRRDGYVLFPIPALSPSDVSLLNDRLERVLRGEYDYYDKRINGNSTSALTEKGNISLRRRRGPDKHPGIVASASATDEGHADNDYDTSNDDQTRRDSIGKEASIDNHTKATNIPGKKKKKRNKSRKPRVLQIVNVHKCDSVFRSLVTSPDLGRAVSALAGWDEGCDGCDGCNEVLDKDSVGICKGGARLAQDQAWIKPPGSPPLVYHRDSPYFMFDPPDVVTVWIALDDMTPEIGPLRYVTGSHRWGDGRVGLASSFFQSDGGWKFVQSAARMEGIPDLCPETDVVTTAGLTMGSLSIHDGRTWHGSDANRSDARTRRGIGLHFVPANVRFTTEAAKSRLWRRYVLTSAETDGEDEEQQQEKMRAKVKKGEERTCVTKVATARFVLPPDEDFPVVWRNRNVLSELS